MTPDTPSPLRSRLQHLFRAREEKPVREAIDVFREVQPFRELPRRVLRELAESVHARVYRRDEYLYYEGDPGLGFYVVRSGRIRLLVGDEQRRVHEVLEVGSNAIIGVQSILGEFRRIESAQAAEETRVFGFFQPDLHTMIKRNPRAGVIVLDALARHVATIQDRMTKAIVRQEGRVAALRWYHGVELEVDSPGSDATVSS